jgi:hypothetical protein
MPITKCSSRSLLHREKKDRCFPSPSMWGRAPPPPDSASEESRAGVSSPLVARIRGSKNMDQDLVSKSEARVFFLWTGFRVWVDGGELLLRIGMKLSVRLGGVEESGMQPGAGIALDSLLALASLKFGSLKRMVVGGRLSGRFSDSLGTAVDGLRGFCLVVAAAGGGGRGFGWRKMGVLVESRMKSRSVGMSHCIYLHVQAVRPPRCVLSDLASLLRVRAEGRRHCSWMTAAVPFVMYDSRFEAWARAERGLLSLGSGWSNRYWQG